MLQVAGKWPLPRPHKTKRVRKSVRGQVVGEDGAAPFRRPRNLGCQHLILPAQGLIGAEVSNPLELSQGLCLKLMANCVVPSAIVGMAVVASRLSLPSGDCRQLEKIWHVQMISYVPDRYRFLFLQGCREAIVESVPVRFGGEVAVLGGTELYRACFMPLKMRTKSTLVT